jgi:DNA invertase Pin-like site-specific DNA recombinase
MATYGYCRVSTARQAAEGESLDFQRRQIEGYALMYGLTVDEVVVGAADYPRRGGLLTHGSRRRTHPRRGEGWTESIV